MGRAGASGGQLGTIVMFIRITWARRDAKDRLRRLRELDSPAFRHADVIGVCRPDFAAMTQGLFDR